jgi:hypothetical protein
MLACFNPACQRRFRSAEARERHLAHAQACFFYTIDAENERHLERRRRVHAENVCAQSEREQETTSLLQREQQLNPQAASDALHTPPPSAPSQASAVPRAPSEDGNNTDSAPYPATQSCYGTPLPGYTFTSRFERLREEQRRRKQSVYGSFEDEHNWGLAEWFIESELSGADIEKHLHLKMVCSWWFSAAFRADPTRQTTERSKPVFSSKYKYYQKLHEVPGGLDWTVHHLDFAGTEHDEQHTLKSESLDLYTADIVEAVRQLVGNPAFAGELRYHAEPVYEIDNDGRWHRKYDEMSSSDWWRKIKVIEHSCFFSCLC